MENYKHTFGNISFNDTPKNIEETFDTIFDDGLNSSYESYEIFSHREEGLNFDYHYLIETRETGGSDEEIICFISLVLHKSSLNEKTFRNILDFCGLNEECGPMVNSDDINSYGASITFESQLSTADNMEELLNNAAHIIPTIEGLIGFYLDKKVNYHDSGWDWIRKFID